MLSNSHLKDVCLLYSCGHQCRYLDEDNLNWNWHCLKHNSAKKNSIDSRIKQVLEDCSKKGIDPYDQGIACGDNCPGYPKLKHKYQGYDVD